MWRIPLYGSLAIQSYGVLLCVGVVFAVWRATQHVWCREIIGVNTFLDVIGYGGIVGIIGARVLHLISEAELYDSWVDLCKVWEGGLSILGAVLALLLFVPWYAHRKNIDMLLMLDLFGLYAALVHAIARVGCWTAGCCGGIASTVPWAIYNEYGHLVHPTQWYSAIIFLVGFCGVRWIVFPYYYRPGSLVVAYVLLISSERFVVDWWRCDRIFMQHLPWFSFHQYIALGMFVGGAIAWYYLITKKKEQYEHLSGG